MALDRLTKIDGGGISTTSDYRVGIITATKFVGPIEGDVTGSITATDGTFSGNVTIGGTLTYEDVTNIDSVGIITARDGIDCNGDLDVDGHTNLDNVNVAGVSTHSDHIHLLDDKRLRLGSAANGDAVLFHNGTDTILDNQTGNLFFRSGSTHLQSLSGEDKIVAEANGTVGLYYDNSQKLGTAGWGVQINGILKVIDSTDSSGATNNLTIGTGSDLKLFHDGSNSFITNTTGTLLVQNSGNVVIDHSGDFYVRSHNGNETRIRANNNGAVELYHDNVKKLETTTSGLNVYGASTAGAVYLKNSGGTNIGWVYANDSGQYFLQHANSHTILKSVQGSAVELYHNNIKRLETSSVGVSIPQDLDVDGHTNLDNVSVAGVSTFTGAIDANGDLDVDGHTNLDNVSVAGVSTFSNHINTENGVLIVAGTTAYSDGTFGQAKLQFNTKTGNHIGACSVADTNNSITHVLFKNPTGAIASVGTHNSDFIALTGNAERLRITSNGQVNINSGSNALGSLRIGGNYDSTGSSNATAKLGTLMMPHYTNAEEPIQMIRGYSDSSLSLVSIGGGTSSANAATKIEFYTASSTTGAGSLKAIIDSSGRLKVGDNTRPASDANEGAQLRVTGVPITRNQYYSPAGHYYGSFGYTDNTYTKSWIAVDSSYAKSSAVSAGIFLSAFHQDAGGSACGFTIKNLKDGNPLVISSVVTAASTSNPAVETERLRITSTGELGLGLTQDPPTGSFTMRLTETPEFNLYSTQHAQNNNCKINFGIGQSASVDGNTGARIEMNIPNAGGQMTGELKFHTNQGDSLQERLRIASDGQVRAGDESGSNRTGYRHQFSSSANSGDVLSLQNPTNSDGQAINLAFWARNTNNAAIEVAKIKGVVDESQANSTQAGSLRFLTNKGASMGERMQINTSGNVRITGATHSNQGTSSGNVPLHVVGGGNNTITMFLGNGNTASNGVNDYSSNIRFNGAAVAWGDLSYYPTGNSNGGAFRFTGNGSTVTSQGNRSIGCSGIFINGTAQAQHLDDYEEGTFNPTYGGTHSGLSGNHRHARYTRIGNMVFISMEYYNSSNNASWSNGMWIGNMPYNSSLSELYSPPSIGVMYGPGGYAMDTDAAGRCYHLGSTNKLYFTFGTSGVRHLWIQFFHRIEN